MTVCLFQSKGGVGKTSLAFSLAKDLKLSFITNDMSIAITKLNGRMYTNNIPYRDNSLYDFGGFKDLSAEEIVKQASITIIPVVNDANSVMRALEALKKVQNVNHVLVANAIENTKDFEDIQKVVLHHFPKTKIMFIRKTKLLKNAMESGMSPIELVKESNIGHVYKNSLQDYINLLKYVKNFSN